MLNWKKSRFFDESYINIGEWDLQYAKQFPHCENIAADTETKLYYNNKQITDEVAYKLYKTNGQSWVKKNIEVKAYAFMIAYENEFILFKNAKDFLTCCSMLNVKNVFWYNAKFDFAIFDYYMLTNGWKSSSEIISNNRYGKLPHGTYQSLNGEFGQRYQLRIWQKYINRKSCERVHNFKMLDICNIFGGGLAKNLKDWNIKDKYGNDIRKLTMSYESADIESDINYLINDTRGLYYLSTKIDETLFNITGFSLFKNDSTLASSGIIGDEANLFFSISRTDKAFFISRFLRPLIIVITVIIDIKVATKQMIITTLGSFKFIIYNHLIIIVTQNLLFFDIFFTFYHIL